jgi:hypothetical protein
MVNCNRHTHTRLKRRKRIYYAWNKRCITKIDTSGNFIWTKKFDALPFPCNSIAHNIKDVVVSGTRIFILDLFEQSGHQYDYYLTVVTLDTAGGYINQWCDPYLVFYTANGVKTINNGCWFALTDPSPSAHLVSYHINENGVRDSVDDIELGNFDHNWFSDYVLLPDSNIYMCGYGSSMFGPERVYFIKYDAPATTSSSLMYGTSLNGQGLKALGVTADSNYNLYYIGYDYVRRHYSLNKIDSSGTILVSKAWSSQFLTNSNLNISNAKIFYRSNFVYLSCSLNQKVALIQFDTLLHSNCFEPDTLSSIIPYGPGIIVRGRIPLANWSQFSSTAYSPVLSPVNLPVTSTDCYIAGIQSVTDPAFAIYPSPFSASVRINFPESKGRLLIINSLGENLQSFIVNESASYVDVSALKAGIYFFSFSSGTYYKTVKAIKIE